MTSKKPADSKRARPPRASDYTKAFFKDWERLSRSGRYDLKRLKEVMVSLIAHDAPPGPEWQDHPLESDWADHRECHIGGRFSADLSTGWRCHHLYTNGYALRAV